MADSQKPSNYQTIKPNRASIVRSISITRLITLIIAGATAGLLVFLILNPSYAREEATGRQMLEANPLAAVNNAFIQAILVGMSFATMLGGILVVADELTSPLKRIVNKMLMAVVISGMLGAVAGVVAQFIFAAFCISQLLLGGMGIIIGRTIGWAVMGAGGGAGVGYAIAGPRRAWMATVGGLLGGGVGGLLFDVVAMVTDGGSVSRFVGFVIMGAATGAAVALVEDIAKQSWVTILSGPKEGKSYILTKPFTSIGRDELADIPLFGDPNVAKQHARLVLQGNIVSVESANGVAVTVNGTHAQSTQLTDGDLLGVGRFNMRFYQKVGAHSPASVGHVPSRWSDPDAQPAAVQSVPQQVIMPPVSMPATGNLMLTIVGGPHMSQQFRFGPGTVRIGREAGYEILLSQDTKVSRNHAEISWNGSQWTVRDLNSTNGLWVRGQRVSEYVLCVGDGFGVGQTVIRVDSV